MAEVKMLEPASVAAASTDPTVLLDLDRYVKGLTVDGHLPECPNPQRPVTDCDWCLWAVGHSGVRETCDRMTDVRTLVAEHRRRRGDVSVAWVVAAGDLLEHFEHAAGTDGVPPDVVVASVRELLARLHRSAADDADEMRKHLDAAVSSGGPVERRCLAGAATVVSAALQRPEARHHRESLSLHTRRILERASLLVSVENQAEHLSVDVERLHWDGVPELRTQPEWRRLPPPHRSNPDDPPAAPPSETLPSETLPSWRTWAPPESDRRCPRPPARGSLESFVVEAVVVELADDLDSVAAELASAVEPMSWTQHQDRRRLSSKTRHMIWKRARIDWNLTFLDTGRAACWSDERGTTMVPWTVALALDEGARLGLVSATHSRD